MTGLETFGSLVSNLGFPILAYLLMYRMARETIQENTQTLSELQTEIKKLQ